LTITTIATITIIDVIGGIYDFSLVLVISNGNVLKEVSSYST
jgi:hypothetical protein